MTRERRRRVGVALGMVAWLLAAACSTSASWAIKRPLAKFSLPSSTTIMVFRPPEVTALDTQGASDALTQALRAELSKQGVASTLTRLQGAPRLPRIELAFRRLELTPAGQYSTTTQLFEGASLVVDVAVVSAKDEVVFVGRIVPAAHRDRLKSAAEAAGRRIARDLTHVD
jgi:hypothetical protein